ncbi:hypothetical protein [Micromonospora echinaurantiaca]|uniref:hypothetical protein n=1 Tax=Micromonospora echinaurantiaca TaxID=47857 RepID=UPI001E56819C|nr:hypothetical protein [Micromonospora echinaurantiaca]
MARDETVVGGGRFDTDRDGYTAMRKYASPWPHRVWAIEGCQGVGRHIANRLLADGEQSSMSAEAVRQGAGVRHRAGPQP